MLHATANRARAGALPTQRDGRSQAAVKRPDYVVRSCPPVGRVRATEPADEHLVTVPIHDPDHVAREIVEQADLDLAHDLLRPKHLGSAKAHGLVKRCADVLTPT